jgi:hypothetical protein
MAKAVRHDALSPCEAVGAGIRWRSRVARRSEVAPDSLLEETGFEPLVPLATEMLMSWQRGLLMQLGMLRIGDVGPDRDQKRHSL